MLQTNGGIHRSENDETTAEQTSENRRGFTSKAVEIVVVMELFSNSLSSASVVTSG